MLWGFDFFFWNYNTKQDIQDSKLSETSSCTLYLYYSFEIICVNRAFHVLNVFFLNETEEWVLLLLF